MLAMNLQLFKRFLPLKGTLSILWWSLQVLTVLKISENLKELAWDQTWQLNSCGKSKSHKILKTEFIIFIIFPQQNRMDWMKCPCFIFKLLFPFIFDLFHNCLFRFLVSNQQNNSSCDRLLISTEGSALELMQMLRLIMLPYVVVADKFRGYK